MVWFSSTIHPIDFIKLQREEIEPWASNERTETKTFFTTLCFGNCFIFQPIFFQKLSTCLFVHLGCFLEKDAFEEQMEEYNLLLRLYA